MKLFRLFLFNVKIHNKTNLRKKEETTPTYNLDCFNYN